MKCGICLSILLTWYLDPARALFGDICFQPNDRWGKVYPYQLVSGRIRFYGRRAVKPKLIIRVTCAAIGTDVPVYGAPRMDIRGDLVGVEIALRRDAKHSFACNGVAK